VADEISELLCAATIVVDSMQVYREIPHITNQPRSRPAQLTGIVSVTEEWTVARHRTAVDTILTTHNTYKVSGRYVLDAGTGMYLNAILMDIDLAPRVEEAVRAEAIRQASELGDDRGGGPGANLRRQARRRELELAGAPARGSIWTRQTRLDADILYLRPPRAITDSAIEARSSRIVSSGIAEAQRLRELAGTDSPPTRQVLGSIGVRELLAYLERERGAPVGQEALRHTQERISVRTRQLARRQVRWFDKMVRTLAGGPTTVTVVEGPSDPRARGFVERCLRLPHA
jgi:tRNA dimethylallyltransferase